MDTDRAEEAAREQRRQRVAVVRRQLVRDGPPWTRDQHGDFEKVTVPEQDCNALRDLLISEQVEKAVEIGLAYGSSALAIGEALVSGSTKRPIHVAIDPGQVTDWSNVGWQLLQSAGLDTIVRVITEPSSMALPRLIAEEFVADAAYVDGSHRFHEVFVDLYFLRKIVRPGGLIVLDDYWWPSVRSAARYFEVNLGFRPIEGAFDGGTLDPRTGHPRTRALRLPDPPYEPGFEDFTPFETQIDLHLTLGEMRLG